MHGSLVNRGVAAWQPTHVGGGWRRRLFVQTSMHGGHFLERFRCRTSRQIVPITDRQVVRRQRAITRVAASRRFERCADRALQSARINCFRFLVVALIARKTVHGGRPVCRRPIIRKRKETIVSAGGCSCSGGRLLRRQRRRHTSDRKLTTSGRLDRSVFGRTNSLGSRCREVSVYLTEELGYDVIGIRQCLQIGDHRARRGQRRVDATVCGRPLCRHRRRRCPTGRWMKSGVHDRRDGDGGQIRSQRRRASGRVIDHVTATSRWGSSGCRQGRTEGQFNLAFGLSKKKPEEQ